MGTEMTKSSRFEYKFLVADNQARSIARELRRFMNLDPWLEKQGTTVYTVSSLYIDSPALQCYEAVEQGARNRFKLRLRWYGKALAQPYFLEEKRRDSEAIIKLRVPIEHKPASDILRGVFVSARDLTPQTVGQRASAQTLLHQFTAIQGIPVCIVRYEREAWESKRYPGLRVTFDQNIRAATTKDLEHDGYPVDLPKDLTVLEIKFRDRVPEWLTSLVRRYGLYRTSVPKYVLCVDALRKYGVSFPGSRDRFAVPKRIAS